MKGLLIHVWSVLNNAPTQSTETSQLTGFKRTLIVWTEFPGINIFQVENSWTELQSANNQLAQERENLERHVTRLSAVITRKDEELSKERGLRKRLLSRWARDEGRQSEHNAAIGQLTRSLLALDSCVTSLDRDVCALKDIFGDGHERSDGKLDSTPSGEAIPRCRSHCACVASPGPDDVTQHRRPREHKHQNLATESADRLGSKDKRRCGVWRLFLWCCLLCSLALVLAHPFTSKYFFNPAWRFTNINSGSSWVGSVLARMRKLLEFLYLTNTS